MIDLKFRSPVLERELRDRFDLLLGIVADFDIVIDGRVLYRETLFPIVELRVSIERWIAGGFKLEQDFEFESLEHDESGLVWIRKQAGAGWRIGSIHQEYIEARSWSDEMVVAAAQRYVRDVDDWIERELQFKVVDYLN